MKIPWMPPALTLLALVAGCATQPFPPDPLPPLSSPDPRAVRANFARDLSTPRVTFDDTLIIQAPFHDDLAILGELAIDRPAATFDLVGLDHLGVTLFQLHGDRQGATIVFAVPPLLQHRDLLLSIAHDMRRIYFDLVPDDDAQVNVGKKEIYFSEKTPQGKLIYEFGGDPPLLLDKHLGGFFGAAWRVSYYQYIGSGATLFPRGIVMDDSQFHYRIIVKTRTMQ